MHSALLTLPLLAAAVGAAQPYLGHPQTIPGRVQMEFYDKGGSGVAYLDTDAVNNGSGTLNKGDTLVDRFRQDEGVDLSYTKKDIDKTVDGEQEKVGELYLGWTAPGEWVNYTVDVKAAGTYSITAHMTSRTGDAVIRFALDGVDITGPVRLPSTTHWHLWRMARLVNVRLSQGVHVLRLSVLREGNFNLDYLDFAPAASAELTAPDQVRQMGRGVNIVGYDPIWRDRTKARFQEKHFRLLRESGFQTVRVNLHAFSHMNLSYQLSEEWFRTLDWVVDQALANRLTVILDEHNFGDCGQNAEGCKPKLMAFWAQVADHYRDAPPQVVFEILNEPNRQLTPALWNTWLREALALIRQTNPDRNVIVGPGEWNNIRALAQLELPAADRHLIATVHYYIPMEFTHQGARWSKETAQLSGVDWGSDADRARVDRDFAGVQQWAVANDRPMLLGEFGAYDKAAMEARVRYTAYLARAAEKLGWAWTYWQFDSDFILWDMALDTWVAPIRDALVPAADRR